MWNLRDAHPGQVGNVIANRNASRLEFERLLVREGRKRRGGETGRNMQDGAKTYMRNHSVGQGMQRRVQRWYDYSWSRGRMTGAADIHSLSLLPVKLKTELAIQAPSPPPPSSFDPAQASLGFSPQVNLKTLRKVSIFQECQPEFLHDLVLKMCAIIFTPGDLICRKGEIAREMYIIADGVLEVIAFASVPPFPSFLYQEPLY